MDIKSVIIILTLIILSTGCAFGGSGGNFSGGGSPAPPNVTRVPRSGPTPSPSPSPERKENEVLGSYSTKLLDKKKARLNNIDLAIAKVNDKVIQPGEVFSFNDTVGPREQARGFQKALILVRKERQLGYGGGVCQVSTTIYNAAKEAGLEIAERHQHDAEIGYVKLGDDAAVSYGTLDLKVKNTKEMPVRFRLSVGADTVDAVVVTEY